MNPSFVGKDQRLVRAAGTLTLLLLLASCGDRGKAVSGTIEVDEAHVGPRAGGRVEKIFAWEGDHLHEGQLIVQLDASELHARRDLATARLEHRRHAERLQHAARERGVRLADVERVLLDVDAPLERSREALATRDQRLAARAVTVIRRVVRLRAAKVKTSLEDVRKAALARGGVEGVQDGQPSWRMESASGNPERMPFAAHHPIEIAGVFVAHRVSGK